MEEIGSGKGQIGILWGKGVSGIGFGPGDWLGFFVGTLRGRFPSSFNHGLRSASPVATFVRPLGEEMDPVYDSWDRVLGSWGIRILELPDGLHRQASPKFSRNRQKAALSHSNHTSRSRQRFRLEFVLAQFALKCIMTSRNF